MKLPELPEPEVHRVRWDGSPGWSQYHDENDPLPQEWDDEPPDETQGFYSGEQLRAYGEMVREECAKVCEQIAAEEEDASPNKNYDLIAFNCAAAIRIDEGRGND